MGSGTNSKRPAGSVKASTSGQAAQRVSQESQRAQRLLDAGSAVEAEIQETTLYKKFGYGFIDVIKIAEAYGIDTRIYRAMPTNISEVKSDINSQKARLKKQAQNG